MWPDVQLIADVDDDDGEDDDGEDDDGEDDDDDDDDGLCKYVIVLF